MSEVKNGAVQFITLDTEVHKLVSRVVETVDQAVTATMGPNGRLAVLTTGTSTKVTKDGVTVARGIQFNDVREEVVNKIMTQAPIKTDEECGDGTTTTIMLTSAFYNLFRSYPTYRDQRFIEEVGGHLITALREQAIIIDVTDERLYKLALTSSNNDEGLSNIIIEQYRAKPKSFPSFDLINGVEDTDKIIRGNGLTINMEFSNSALYAGPGGGKRNLVRYVPIILDDSVRNADGDRLSTLLASLMKAEGNTPFLDVVFVLICRSVETSMDSLLVAFNNHPANKQAQRNVIGCRVNGTGGSVGSMIMQDLAAIFGVPSFSALEQIQVTEDMLITETPLVVGTGKSVFTPNDASLVRIAGRIELIKEALGNYDGATRFGRRARFDEERVRNLSGEVITIWVGGETEADVKERKDRFEDVIKAVKSALTNGILPGVGTSMIAAMRTTAKLYDAETDQNKRNILEHIEEVCFMQYERLTADVKQIMEQAYANQPRLDNFYPVVNLANGEVGLPEDLGIYDTAHASVVALKGGMQTAKILANLSSVLITNKLHAVNISQQ